MEHLPEFIINEIKGLYPCVLATERNGKPYTTFITWFTVINKNTARMALSSDSYSAENLRKNPYCSIEILGKNFALSISGTVKELITKTTEFDITLSIFELKITHVVDNLFPGGTITDKIPFLHTDKKFEKLDEIILNYLRQ